MFLPIDVGRAMASWGEELDPDGKTPDFSASCQPHPTSPKTQNHKCKQVHAMMLREKGWSLICYLSLELMTKIHT